MRARAKAAHVAQVLSGDAPWLDAHPERWVAQRDEPFPDRGATRAVAGLTPLCAAVHREPDAAVVASLLRRGADPFRCNRGRSSTAINCAQALPRFRCSLTTEL